MSATLMRTNTRILNALASLAISMIGTNATIRSNTAPVSVIACIGVPKRSLTRVRDGGARLSRLIASGYRDDERMPALAVLTSAMSAAAMIARRPSPPSVCSAASAIGMFEPASSSLWTTPTMTTTRAM